MGIGRINKINKATIIACKVGHMKEIMWWGIRTRVRTTTILILIKAV